MSLDQRLEEIGAQLAWVRDYNFDPEALARRKTGLEEAMGEPGFWGDQAGAARISTEHARTTRKLERYERLQREYEDAKELLTLGE